MHCKACHSDKLESDFYTCNHSRCKACCLVRMAEYRQANREKLRADNRARARMPDRRASSNVHSRAWQLEFPNRIKAHHKVEEALRSGALKKQPCWVCGEKAVAHHADYDRPLDVVWLCPVHHSQTHVMARNLKATQ